MYYLYLCICKSAKCMSVELKVYLFIWSHNFWFSMSLSLSPNLLYRQTSDCTEGGGLTREHCIDHLQNRINILMYHTFQCNFYNIILRRINKIRVSERWLLNTKWSIFQLYHEQNNLHFDEMMMMAALYYINILSYA